MSPHARVYPGNHERTPLLGSGYSNLVPSGAGADEEVEEHIKQSSPTGRSKDEALSAASAKFWLLFLAYAAVLFLNTANATALTTTYGAIAETLHAYRSAATWLNASYIIASSCTTPLVGRLATLFRPTSLFLSCTALFTIGAGLTGLAPSLSVFLLGRVLGGCGGSGLFTAASILLIEGAPVRRRGLLIGVLNAVITVGTCLGGVIAGALAASSYGWRPAFLLQVPLTVVMSIIIYFLSPSPEAKYGHLPLLAKLKRVDWLGILTLTGSLVLLLTAAVAPVFSPVELLLGVCGIFVFGCIELYVASLPVIPVRVLLHPPTFFTCLAAVCTMGARWVVLFYSPIWSIAVLGFHPAAAGAVLIPSSVGFAFGGVVTGWLWVRHGGRYYWQSLVAVVLFSLPYILFLRSPSGLSLSASTALLVANGLGIGAILNFGLANVLATTDEKTIVTGLYTTFRGLSPSIGAGIAGGLLQRSITTSLRYSFSRHHIRDGQPPELTPADLELIEKLKGSPTLVWQLREGWRKQAAVLAYEAAIRKIFWVALMTLVLGFVLQALTAIGVEGSTAEVKGPAVDEHGDSRTRGDE